MAEIEHFELLMHGVQAIRRRVERLSCPISGASGVRAQFYPHQVQNVRRILSANRIRHLIADEVGMGKTIQALMVANALRLQLGSLRVRIVVPRGELQAQWITEIRSRAQSVPELTDEMLGDDWFHVVDDSSMVKPSEVLKPEDFDLLILDEPQSLKQDTLRFVASNASDFPRLLLLTASPNLRDMRRFLELLQILEPERIERARREADRGTEHVDLDWTRSRIGDLSDYVLNRIEQQFNSHCAEVVNGKIETDVELGDVSSDFESLAEFRRVRVLAETRWKYRNVLRSYRTDFPDHLPKRLPKRIIVEPTSGERERMQASLSYIGEFLQEHQEAKHRQAATALLQRTSLGGQSLQGRLVRMRRGEAEHESRLVRMSELSRREYADSRLDCLVDWLIRFWKNDPNRKVVIAAEDNATVNELADEIGWRIPNVGLRGRRRELQTVLATDERTPDDTDDDILSSPTLRNIANSKLRGFEESDAQLLIAHNVFRQSYNLQAADALIFYALPWKPEDVDQWIGRVDRLGREFVDPEKPNSRPKPIRILNLHRQGDPTIGVQEVLDEYRVFETAVDPERKLLSEITGAIEGRALPTAIVDGRQSQLRFEFDDETQVDRGNERRSTETKETTVPSGSPWTVQNAIDLFNRVARREDLGPALSQSRNLGYVTSPSEEALAKWISMLRNHKWINVIAFKGQKQKDGRRSRTFYTLGQAKSVDVKLESVQDKSHPFPPFFIARGNIQRPPRTDVETSEDYLGNVRIEPLQFLSFGSPLHEDLVDTFVNAGHVEQPFGIVLYSLGQRHYPKRTELTTGRYLAGVGYIDSAARYADVDFQSALSEMLTEASGTRRNFMRQRVIANLEAGLQADKRFVRLQRPPELKCLAWRLEAGNRMVPCDGRVAADLFSGDWHRKERPNTEVKRLPPEYTKQLPGHCRTQIAQSTATQWAIGMDEVAEAFEERRQIILIETEDRLWILRAACHEIQWKIERREANPTEANRQAVATTYRPRLEQFREEIAMTQMGCELRLDALKASLDDLRNPQASDVVLQCSVVIELANDPVPMPEADEQSEESRTAKEFGDGAIAQVEDANKSRPNKPR